jgi:hypothetical protein
VRQSPGYYLAAGPDDVDLSEFSAAAASSAAVVEAQRWDGALAAADAAMALWRGQFLEDPHGEHWRSAVSACVQWKRGARVDLTSRVRRPAWRFLGSPACLRAKPTPSGVDEPCDDEKPNR